MTHLLVGKEVFFFNFCSLVYFLDIDFFAEGLLGKVDCHSVGFVTQAQKDKYFMLPLVYRLVL